MRENNPDEVSFREEMNELLEIVCEIWTNTDGTIQTDLQDPVE